MGKVVCVRAVWLATRKLSAEKTSGVGYLSGGSTNPTISEKQWLFNYRTNRKDRERIQHGHESEAEVCSVVMSCRSVK